MQIIIAEVMKRRAILSAAVALPLLALPGCATNPRLSLIDAVRRLLTLSSQRAFATLLAPGGFYDSEVARITLPDRLGGENGQGKLAQFLTSSVIRTRLLRQVNRAAEQGANRAAPVIADAIIHMPVADAVGILRGGRQRSHRFVAEPDGRPAFRRDASRRRRGAAAF